jgi:biotin operon repressor
MRSLQLCKVGYTSKQKLSLKLEISFQNVDKCMGVNRDYIEK